MFSWARPSRAGSYSKYEGSQSRLNNDEKNNSTDIKDNYVKNSKYLPRISPHKYASDSSRPIFTENYRFQEKLDKQGQESETALGALNNYSRAHSSSPFKERTNKKVSYIKQQKQYAQILEEQIRGQNAKKVEEKLKDLELDKKILEDGDFYKYFEGSNHIERFVDNALGTSLEEHSKKVEENIYRTNSKVLEKSPEKHWVFEKNIETSLNEKNSYKNAENHFQHSDQIHTNRSRTNNDFQEKEHNLKEKIKDYVRKLEYKKVLETQILEKNLRKKHQEEIKAMEDKLEEVRAFKFRIIGKASHNDSKKASRLTYENSSYSPDFPNDSLSRRHETEPYNLGHDKSREGKSFNIRRLLTANEERNSFESKYNRPIYNIKTNEKQDFNYLNEEENPGLSNILSNSRNFESDKNLSNYLHLQNEFEKMKGDVQSYMIKMDDKLTDIQLGLGNHERANEEISSNRDSHKPQAIKHNYFLCDPDFHIIEPSLKIPSFKVQAPSSSDSKQSLNNKSRFIPLRKIVRQEPNQNYILTPDLNSSKVLSKKIEQAKSLSEYAPIMTDMVTLARRLQRSILEQQQNITKDLESIQSKLRPNQKDFEKNMHIEFVPDLEYNNYHIKEKNQIGQTKLRAKSWNIDYQKKGIRRKREELSKD